MINKKEFFLIRFFKYIKETILKLVFHEFCGYCKNKITYKEIFCHSCLNSLPLTIPKFEKKNKILIYYLGKYDGFLRFIVNQKYHKNNIAYYGLEKKIQDFFKLYKLIDNFDIIIPVPKFSLSKIKQTFNQNVILAEIIQNIYNKKIFDKIYTKQFKSRQVTASYAIRKKNNKNIFFIPDSYKHFLEQKKILIIDDVYTTGATIESMLDAIKNISYCSVSVFVLAMG